MLSFSIITPTIQRESLIRCCDSVTNQTHTAWQHIVVVDQDQINSDLNSRIGHPQRLIVRCASPHHNFGNTCRHWAWKLAQNDYLSYLDDDNHFAHNNALADIARALESSPHWAVFPILRFGQRFFSSDPRCCHVDSANMVIRRDIAQWPNRDEYTLDGIFCEELKTKYSWSAFPDVPPIITVPVQSKGE